jgi:hypothetical protein
MSRFRSVTLLLWAAVQRAVPVTVVVFVAFAVAKWSGLLLPVRSVGPFHGDLPDVVGWFGMVSLPLLAWALWAPTAKLALRVGLLLVLGVVGWGWLLHRAWVGDFTVDRLTLYWTYPIAAGVAVVLAALVAYVSRWRHGAASSGTRWSRLAVTVRVLIGCLALLVAVALGSIWTNSGPPVVAALRPIVNA